MKICLFFIFSIWICYWYYKMDVFVISMNDEYLNARLHYSWLNMWYSIRKSDSKNWKVKQTIVEICKECTKNKKQ